MLQCFDVCETKKSQSWKSGLPLCTVERRRGAGKMVFQSPEGAFSPLVALGVIFA